MTNGLVLASDQNSVGVGGVIAIAIVAVIFSAIVISVTSYFRLQRHRADAVANAAFRKLAEEAVERQDQLLVELKALDAKVTEIELLLRSVE
jgi:type II secretory pathway pseudopilin PulG